MSSIYDDRIYFDTKKLQLIHLEHSHREEKVNHYWWSNYHGKHGIIKGKLKVPKHWVLLGTCSEKTISRLKMKK